VGRGKLTAQRIPFNRIGDHELLDRINWKCDGIMRIIGSTVDVFKPDAIIIMPNIGNREEVEIRIVNVCDHAIPHRFRYTWEVMEWDRPEKGDLSGEGDMSEDDD